MRHPCAANRAAQFMLASPSSVKHVPTPSCVNAFARMSYTRGLASAFIAPVPGRDPASVQRRACKPRSLQPSCWCAWLHLASLVEERADLSGDPLVFLDLAVGTHEVRE